MIENTRQIPLSQGQRTLIDAVDFEMLSRWKWYATKAGRDWYVIAYDAKKKGGNGSSVMMHRVIIGATKTDIVDHINGDPLDNRRANLRICTHAENMRNRTSAKGSKSAYLGVAWETSRGLWRATITSSGVHHFLGRFKCEQAAAMAYDAAARLHHGRFANLNFPYAHDRAPRATLSAATNTTFTGSVTVTR